MYDLFPTSISAIPLSYETTDNIEEFTCEFQVLWWEAVVGNSPAAGGANVN
jgi:hypothetical protein